MDEYKLFYNLKGNTLNVYKKAFKKENYEILSENKKDIVLVEKGRTKLSEEQINLILDIAHCQCKATAGILIVDITEAVEYLVQQTNEGKEVYKDGVFRWKLKNIIMREQSNKRSKEVKE